MHFSCREHGHSTCYCILVHKAEKYTPTSKAKSFKEYPLEERTVNLDVFTKVASPSCQKSFVLLKNSPT